MTGLTEYSYARLGPNVYLYPLELALTPGHGNYTLDNFINLLTHMVNISLTHIYADFIMEQRASRKGTAGGKELQLEETEGVKKHCICLYKSFPSIPISLQWRPIHYVKTTTMGGELVLLRNLFTSGYEAYNTLKQLGSILFSPFP